MNRESILETPIGKLYARLEHNSLQELKIGKALHDSGEDSAQLNKKLKQQLLAYFKNAQHRFDIPVELHGTPFQKRVWQALTKIPAGKTLSYGELADKLGSSARAVGNACRANPIPIIIPCHRVVSKSGLGGYDGKTSGRRLDIKRWLLAHEGRQFN